MRPRVALFAALATLGVALADTRSAHGHGGTLLLEERAGPYDVVLNGASLAGGSAAVDYTVTLRRDGRPEEAAGVRLRVRTSPGGAWTRSYTAERVTNTYEVVLSQPEHGSWKSWDVRIELDGPAGPARIAHLAGSRPAPAPAPVAPLIASLAVLLLLGTGAVVVVRRRREAGGASLHRRRPRSSPRVTKRAAALHTIGAVSQPTTAQRARPGLGLPFVALVALAALAVPRAVAHDLDLASGAVNAVLAVAPPIVWIAVVLARGVRRPFKTLLAIGLLYGVMLAATHQIFWNELFDDDPEARQDAAMRVSTVVSSLVVGLVVGAIAGAVATALDRVRSRRVADV